MRGRQDCFLHVVWLLFLSPLATRAAFTICPDGGLVRKRPLKPTLVLSSSYNPNDQESPEERERRMELVRKIQSSFYRESGSEGRSDDFGSPPDAGWMRRDPHNPQIIHNLPLWRVQWTELPGYQNVLNVHAPHYTHMFRKIIFENPKPWLFGSAHLPEGSENLGNPEYFLPENEVSSLDLSSSREDVKQTNQVTTVATLMQITDYRVQEDGRLTLIVQGIGRIKVLAASQQVPYAVAKVQIYPDDECWEQYWIPLVKGVSTDFDLTLASRDATKDCAAVEEMLLRELEYHQTKFGEDVDGQIPGVSPLSNLNGSVALHVQNIEQELDRALSQGLARHAEEGGSDEMLLASSTMRLQHGVYGTQSDSNIEARELDVWIELDRMIQLLRKAQPKLSIPVPAQVLGLMPVGRKDWPKNFQLEAYANKLEADNVKVGTYSKSPFVRVSREYKNYPTIRRASRLSYCLWVMLSSIALENEEIDLQKLLETTSIQKRLDKVHSQLKKVNKAIARMF